MGSRYLFIVLYVFLEDHLSRGDYRRSAAAVVERPVAHPPHGAVRRVRHRLHRRLERR
jgi:dolichol-phosphate mannosyltransferase